MPGMEGNIDDDENDDLSKFSSINQRARKIMENALKKLGESQAPQFGYLEGVSRVYTELLWPSIRDTVLDTRHPPSQKEHLLLGPKQNMLHQEKLRVEERRVRSR